MAREFLHSITLVSGIVKGWEFDPLDASDLPVSGVTPGSYSLPTFTVDSYGRITSVVGGSLVAGATYVSGTPTETGTLIAGEVGGVNRVLVADAAGHLAVLRGDNGNSGPVLWTDNGSIITTVFGTVLVVGNSEGSSNSAGGLVFGKGDDGQRFILFTGEVNVAFNGFAAYVAPWNNPGAQVLADAYFGDIFVSQVNAGAGLYLNIRIVTAAGAVTVDENDCIIVINKTVGAATTVNLTNPIQSKQIIKIKDGKGDAAANNITIVGPGGSTIDGAANFVIATNYQAVEIVYNGTEWNILSRS